MISWRNADNSCLSEIIDILTGKKEHIIKETAKICGKANKNAIFFIANSDRRVENENGMSNN